MKMKINLKKEFKKINLMKTDDISDFDSVFNKIINTLADKISENEFRIDRIESKKKDSECCHPDLSLKRKGFGYSIEDEGKNRIKRNY